ncbi:MAG TPA: class I SAM-dependent methyltransferase, partial [Patescibacteria group bacterium]|nr:class I SAM-dependent methyltransferase [Patescibacteria group bacterium]
ENIEAIRANLEVLGSSRLPDNSQDMVLLANILFQSTKKREIISEAARVLKTGGSLIVIDWKKGTGGGPPDELRAEPTEMKALLSADIFSFQKDIDAGSFHYGMMFVKR